ncbi:MAG: hypothetical protein KA978_06900 [Deltaproteobacteria bacterium]|nr:hypothetical protein [Deltaproteobacteria bacterium]
MARRSTATARAPQRPCITHAAKTASSGGPRVSIASASGEPSRCTVGATPQRVPPV